VSARLRLYLKTGLIAIGVLFGPDLLFGTYAVGVRLATTGSADQVVILFPVMMAALACALWALVAGHWYVRAWFMMLAVGWNLWAMLDVLNRAKDAFECTYVLPWLVWTVWFSFRLVQWGERAKAAARKEQ
jgi:hypothetical protein